MHQHLDPMRDRVSMMKQRGIKNESQPPNPVEEIEAIKSDLSQFTDSIITLSKHCLTELHEFHQSYLEMSQDINSMEGMIKLIKDCNGNKTLIQGVEVPRIDYEEEIPVTYASEDAIILPTGNYVLNFSALDQIGQTIKNIQENLEGMPLIREILPDDQSPQLWSQQEDYFVESQESRKTADPTRSSFVMTYNIEPSLYPPNSKKYQRSVTQTEIESGLFN